MPKLTIGIDFGTLSARAALVDTRDGRTLAEAEYIYPHAVIDHALPNGTPLGDDWALQHPQDYVEAFYHTIPEVLRLSGAAPADVAGVGIDFTACTFLPIRADGMPLCMLPAYSGEPHAWVKLWKHHAAQSDANRLNAVAEELGEPWLSRYGGKISSEWQVPKVMQVVREAPHIYAAADHFIEAADWVVWALCGAITRNACTAGYKGIWSASGGYPGEPFFAALDPRMAHYTEEKLSYPIIGLGKPAGGLTEAMAARTGLLPGTCVAAANVDAHVTMAAAGIDRPGVMLAIMGTSTCHMLLGPEECIVPGMCGVVRDGILPGLYGYEAGQSCVGDHFAWFAQNCLPGEYLAAAESAGLTPLEYLSKLAAQLKPGESGLVALDWWNGNRSVLVDVDLQGLILGLTLQTRPEEIYRTLIEATAYGTRTIIETFRASGVPVDAFVASGGISQKDPLTMQIYADVLGLPIGIAEGRQGPALGSAIFAAVGAGVYADIFEAARAMGSTRADAYRPDAHSQGVYDALYAEYKQLHDWFGRGGSDAMKRLKAIRQQVKHG